MVVNVCVLYLPKQKIKGTGLSSAWLSIFICREEPQAGYCRIRFDRGWGELPVDWLLSFIGRFGHVLYSIKTASWVFHKYQIWRCRVIQVPLSPLSPGAPSPRTWPFLKATRGGQAQLRAVWIWQGGANSLTVSPLLISSPSPFTGWETWVLLLGLALLYCAFLYICSEIDLYYACVMHMLFRLRFSDKFVYRFILSSCPWQCQFLNPVLLASLC